MALSDDDKQWISDALVSVETKVKDYIDERTHDAETRLLRGFADYNASASIRLRKIEADASNLDTSSTLRLGELERQVADLQAKVISLEGRVR
jgi:hypothetical protein